METIWVDYWRKGNHTHPVLLVVKAIYVSRQFFGFLHFAIVQIICCVPGDLNVAARCSFFSRLQFPGKEEEVKTLMNVNRKNRDGDVIAVTGVGLWGL